MAAATDPLDLLEVCRAAAAPGPNISRYERPRAVRRSRSGTLQLLFTSLGPVTRVEYAPEADGEPDPGEVVWGWVPYEDDPAQGKDRPVLLLALRGDRWLGLMLSSQDHDLDADDEARHGRYWIDVGTGGWDSAGRASEVRLDRLLELDPATIRREGSALDEEIFRAVLAAAGEYHALEEA